MRHNSNSSKSSKNNQKVNFKFSLKDKSIFKAKWNSPNDKKSNTLNVKFGAKNSVEIKDNH